jgi:photosystem II stability/assembly factor-like uncharacterized protein
LGAAVHPSLEAAGAASCRAGALASLLAVSAWAVEVPEPPVLSAEPARLAAHSLLIALAAAGTRLVAVGDHGIIVLSDDAGASWSQAQAVPSQALLTGVCFLDAQHGVAVGHDEVIVTSADAGRTWKRVHDNPGAERPLLDVWCGAAGKVIAVGAYQTVLESDDGGEHWREMAFNPAPPPAPARTAHSSDAGGGYHLNRITAADDGRLYIAAEAGHLYASDDHGTSWLTLTSPYEGSFFGVLPLGGETVLAFGLRGNLYRSEDAGASWRRIDTGTVAMLDGGTRIEGGAALVGLSGVVLVSRDGGRSFVLQQQSDRSGLSAARSAGAGTLAAVGENGAQLIRLADAPSAAGTAR